MANDHRTSPSGYHTERPLGHRDPAEDMALDRLLRMRQRVTHSPRRELAPVSTQGGQVHRDKQCSVVDQLATRLVPDELWTVVEQLIPPAKVRPQGGGRSRVNDRMVFTAIVFVLASGCAWRHLPPSFGVTVPTVHRRFQEWTEMGLWHQLHRVMPGTVRSRAELHWVLAMIEVANARANKAAS